MKGITIEGEQEHYPERDYGAYNITCRSLYVLLKQLARTMRRNQIPFFVDLDGEIDGSIKGCHLVMDQQRYEAEERDLLNANKLNRTTGGR